MDQSKIIAVVVTYNGSKYIEKCLSSLQESSVPVGIVVVDNQSTDATVEIIQREFCDVEVMVSPENLGFGKGNNIGIKYAYEIGADFVFLLNQDAFIEPDTVEKLCVLQRERGEYGLLSPVQLDGPGQQLDHKFSIHLSKSKQIGEMLSDLFLKNTFADLYEVDFVNAAAWMLSRECVERVGLFNPVFEHYGEDMEYTHRVQNKGMNVGLATEAFARHDRDQFPRENGVQRDLMLKKAAICYRLCRRNPSVIINIQSCVQLVLYSKGWGLKVRLLFFLLKYMFAIIKKGNEAYAGERAYFADTPAFTRGV